jgi:anti-sigma B factor antagonist
MDSERRIRSESRGDIAVFYLKGEIDLYTSPAIREELNKTIDRKKKKILISFKDVSYIDSSGLATLVELYQRAKKWKGNIVLVEMEDSVQGVFELSRLDKIFTILPAVEEGVSFFKK